MPSSSSMDRTPIKIPGKRKGNPRAKIITSASSRPRGRPLKLTPSNKMDWDSTQSSLQLPPTKKRSMRNIKSKNKMSLLEKLPVELLELIYLSAMEISLPRSSPVIAGKLSREYTYIKTIIGAFHSTWETFHGRSPDLRVPESDSSVASFQSAILRCRWASVSLLLKAKNAWVQQYAGDRPFIPKWFISDDDDHESPIELMADEYFDANFSRFTNFHLIDGLHMRFSWIPDGDVESNVEIPESLLLGPWSEEAIRLLFWLVKSGARLNFRYSTSGEAASIGLQNAISAGDVRVIHLLLEAGLRDITDDRETLLYALENAGGNKLQVVNFLMMQAALRSPDSWKGAMIDYELEEMKSKALREGNCKELTFVDAIIHSRWFQHLQDFKFTRRGEVSSSNV